MEVNINNYFALTIKNSSLYFLVLLLLLFNLGSCQDNEETILYTTEIPENLDATCNWLENENNFHTKNYMTVFYNYYTNKIKAKEFKSAIKALEIVSLNKSSFREFDTKFRTTLLLFEKNYSDKVSKLETTFLNTYLGNEEVDRGNFKKALTFYNKITTLEPEDYKSCKNIGFAYFDVSYCYYNIGDQDLALKNNFKALEYLNKTNCVSCKNYIYSNFSLIYLSTKNYDQALKSTNTALEYCRQTSDSANTFYNLQDKISIYKESKNKNLSALIDSTYTLFKTYNLNEPSLRITILTLYTSNALKENKTEEVKQILDQLKPEVIKLNSINATQEYNIARAEYEIKKNNGIVDLAIIKNVIPTLIKNEDYLKLQSFYKVLKDNAISKNDYEKALLYENDLQKASDSLGSKEIKNKVIEINKKNELKKKEQQIAIQKKTITNKNTTIALLIFLLIVLFLLALIISFKEKQKKLKSERKNVQLYNKQLLQKTEEDRKRIAGDLHDSVSHELLSLKNLMEEKNEANDKKIDKIINEIRNISRNLHPVMFDKIGLQASIEQMVERVQINSNFLVTADINYNNSLSSNNELQVYRIIQEALSNIIKYADAIAAKIIISDNNNKFKIIIKDNGKGFNVKETLSNSDAFGLHNIIERSRVIGGKAKITSSHQGTIITIEI